MRDNRDKNAKRSKQSGTCSGGSGARRGGFPATSVRSASALCASTPILAVMAVLWSTPGLAQTPYNFYGGDVEADRKNAAIEACEYEELVEKQRCNKSLNKTSCIARIREECRVKFGGDQSAPASEEERQAGEARPSDRPQ